MNHSRTHRGFPKIIPKVADMIKLFPYLDHSRNESAVIGRESPLNYRCHLQRHFERHTLSKGVTMVPTPPLSGL